jgi:hypothetical protein
MDDVSAVLGQGDDVLAAAVQHVYCFSPECPCRARSSSNSSNHFTDDLSTSLSNCAAGTLCMRVHCQSQGAGVEVC